MEVSAQVRHIELQQQSYCSEAQRSPFPVLLFASQRSVAFISSSDWQNPQPPTLHQQLSKDGRNQKNVCSCAIPIPCIRRNATARQISQAPVNVPERIQEVTGASYSQLSHSGGVSPPICAILQLFGVRNLLRQKLQSTQDSAGCVLHSRTGFVD